MEKQKIVNLLKSSDNEYSKFATKSGTLSIAVTRTIATAGDNPVQKKEPFDVATQVAFKNCAPFKGCRTEINNTLVNYAEFINIAMPMYNLTEHSDNYSDSSGSLWGFQRDEVTNNADVNNDDNAPSFKYKSSHIADTEANETLNEVKIVKIFE